AFNDMAGRLRHSFHQLRGQLLFDPLTGLLTRRGLLEKADGPQPRRAVLVLAGLDAFRAVNDSMGLDTGDRLLRAIAERLQATQPGSALIARLGGDEFALLLPATDERATQALIDRIGSLLELNNQFYPGRPLSLAIGMAIAASGDQLEAAVHRADQAMYAE
ncbi:GGDEF domain-containing protein, partial [Corynebacterium sp. 35RC1]|nr:GGDEF domain-containing protein [Corynebacterium sp. 35RC1]